MHRPEQRPGRVKGSGSRVLRQQDGGGADRGDRRRPAQPAYRCQSERYAFFVAAAVEASIGHGSIVTTLNHGVDPDRRADMIPASVMIGCKVWLGAGVTIVPG